MAIPITRKEQSIFPGGERGDLLSDVLGGISLSFQETKSGGSYERHKDPLPRFVVTLGGALEFETRTRNQAI